MESPPRAKKLSVVLTCVTPNTACQISTNACSVALAAATKCSAAANSSAGRRLRSSLPLGLRGICASQTRWLGTM
ncbi:hypothetical protein D3C85_678870 [compost metagenome]